MAQRLQLLHCKRELTHTALFIAKRNHQNFFTKTFTQAQHQQPILFKKLNCRHKLFNHGVFFSARRFTYYKPYQGMSQFNLKQETSYYIYSTSLFSTNEHSLYLDTNYFSIQSIPRLCCTYTLYKFGDGVIRSVQKISRNQNTDTARILNE